MNAVPSTCEPIYPLAYAARLAGLNAGTARRWLRGHSYTYGDVRRHSHPVIGGHGSVPEVSAVSFEALLTLRLVRAFRERGLGMPTIKAAARIAATRYASDNPFVTRAFHTDGRKIFIELQAQDENRGADRVMVEALTGQQQFQAVVEPSLFQDVVFTGDDLVEWRPVGKDRSIVVRPDRAFGAPHIDGTGIRTDVVADAVTAEGGDGAAHAAVSAWFGLSAEQVADAIAAEAGWAHKKAA